MSVAQGPANHWDGRVGSILTALTYYRTDLLALPPLPFELTLPQSLDHLAESSTTTVVSAD